MSPEAQKFTYYPEMDRSSGSNKSQAQNQVKMKIWDLDFPSMIK